MLQKRILLIDDDADIQETIKLTLKTTSPWSVIFASSGIEGIKLAEMEQPDAILLDMMMPEMNGLTTLKLLQEQQQTRNIPVIILTAKVQERDFPHLYMAGVVGALAKPFDPLMLANHIAGFLGWPSPS